MFFQQPKNGNSDTLRPRRMCGRYVRAVSIPVSQEVQLRKCMLIVAAAMVGCSSSTSPVSPTPANVSIPLSTAPTSGATLAISAFDVRLLKVSDGWNVYRPTLVLSETSLKDAATLTDIVLSIPDGDSFSIIVKGGTPLRVPPGQTWDLAQSPYYPAFIDIDSRAEVAAVRATVTFVDGVGVHGSITSTAMVQK
jgi:hypothetical protein